VFKLKYFFYNPKSLFQIFQYNEFYAFSFISKIISAANLAAEAQTSGDVSNPPSLIQAAASSFLFRSYFLPKIFLCISKQRVVLYFLSNLSYYKISFCFITSHFMFILLLYYFFIVIIYNMLFYMFCLYNNKK